MKNVEFNGQSYNVNMLTVEQAEEIFSGSLKPAEMNRRLVSSSTGIPNEQIALMPWPAFRALLAAALEVNGLVGEVKGAPAPAEGAPVNAPAS